MKKNKTLKAAIAVFGLAFVSSATAEMATSNAISITCAGCHGTNGISAGPAIPTIAGLSSTYLVEAMENYKSGDAYSTIMGRIAKGYSTAEFEAMGAFFEKQTFVAADQSSGDKAAAGMKIHDKSCERCHSEGGSLAEDDSGKLSGQWTPYLQYTMTDLLAGEHPMPKQMKNTLKKIHSKEGPAGYKALLDYYSSNK